MDCTALQYCSKSTSDSHKMISDTDTLFVTNNYVYNESYLYKTNE